MRDIINKIFLVESANYDPETIIKNLKKSKYYDYEILIKVNVNFSLDDSYGEDMDVDAEISFDFLKSENGYLEWADQTNEVDGDYIAFHPNFLDNINDWEYQVVVTDAEHFLPSIKEKLKTMGFSDRAIKRLKVTFLNGDFLLTGCKLILNEVIESHEWYRNMIGEIG